MDDLTELLAELARDAAEVAQYEELAEEARQRIRANLPLARQAGVGPAELERVIHSIYVAKTISRWTSGAAPDENPRGGARKRGGAPPRPVAA